MLDPRKVRGLLKTIRDFDGFSSVTVSDGETTVSVVRGEAEATAPKPATRQAKSKPVARHALSGLGDLPPVGVYPDQV